MKIAITGKMCSGKTTLANIIKESNDKYNIYSFGKKVKQVAKDLFNMTEKDRTLLTSIATKMREIDSNVWINYIINETKNNDFCIIDDLRFQNEYEELHKNNFKIIQLTIENDIQTERIKKVYPNNYMDHLDNRNHISEKNEFQWIDKENVLIINSCENSKNEIIEKVFSFINK